MPTTFDQPQVSAHPDLFREAPIAILCEDWSAIRSAVLRDCPGGAEDLDRLLSADPAYLSRMRGLHRIVDANPAALQLLGVATFAELGRHVGELLPADPNGSVVRAIVDGERSCRGERDLLDSRGVRTPILWQTTLPERPEDFARMYFFAVDISEQRRAQEGLDVSRAALNHAGRLSLVGELVASMTHEVSQPVSSIGLLAGATSRWLAHSPPNLAEAGALVARIEASAKHAAQVIRRIRDFSRASPTRYTSLAPATLAAEAVALVEHEARRQGVSLRLTMAADLPDVCADAIQVKQVIVNVAINALQAIAGDLAPARERTVTLTLARQGDFVRFVVVDTGPGMVDRERALEPFFTTKEDGLGLGLSICRRIVEDHGGVLSIASGQDGTEVSFTLRGVFPARGRGEQAFIPLSA